MKAPSFRSVLKATVAGEPLLVGNYLAWCAVNGERPIVKVQINIAEGDKTAAAVLFGER